MRKIILLIFLSITFLGFCEKVAEFNELFKYPRIKIDKDNYYIFNYTDYAIYVYSRKEKKLKCKIGKKGEGPGEFIRNVTFHILRDSICINSSGKVAYFDKGGRLLKEIKLNSRLYRVKPIDSLYFGETHDSNIKSKIGETFFKIFDKDFKPIKEIYSIKTKLITVYKGAPKQDMPMIRSFAQPQVFDNKIYIGDTEKGFYFAIFNKNGELLKEINYEYEKRKVAAEDKRKVLIEYRERQGEGWENSKAMFNFVFPEYYPPFRTFRIDDSKIYCFTHLKIDNKRETFILDENGNLLKRTFVPSGHPSALFKGKFYYLKDNDEEELFELHCEAFF